MAFSINPFVSSLVSGTYKAPAQKPVVDPFTSSLVSGTYKAPVTPTAPVTKTPTTPVTPTPVTPTAKEPAYKDISQQEVEAIYGPSYSRLGDIERNLRAGEQDFYTQYTQPYEQLKPQLTSALEEGKILGRQQVGETEQSRENAVADARRLYNELFAGSQQRFGGSSSAGEFANAYLGREFQRQLGGIQGTVAQNLQKIAAAQETLQRNYQSQVQQLDLQKAGALNQAQNLFRQQLNEINNTRFGLEQNKAAAKLQTLREHVARVNNLRDYFTQQDTQLKNSLILARQQGQFAGDWFNKLAGTTIPTQNITPVTSPYGTNTPMPATVPQGQVGTTYKWDPQTGRYVPV